MSIDKSLKQRIFDVGYTVERVYADDQFKGMKLKKGGVQVHTKAYITYESAKEIIEAEEKRRC